MTQSSSEKIAIYLAERKQKGLYRCRLLSNNALDYLDFSCNDYLSLADDPQVKKAYQEGFERFPVGSGGSMVLSGYHESHRLLEQTVAQALKVDDCLLFSSGYVANLSVTSLLVQFGLHVLIDKSVHASIYDGLELARGQYTRFLHNNLSDLQRKLVKFKASTAVFTEATFSMSGLHAPLFKMASLLNHQTTHLIVDEAHSFGICGPQGLGAVIAAGLTQDSVPLRMIPFGKAFCGSGAIVAGKAEWIDALLQATRQPVYSTAISPAFTYGLTAVFAILRHADERRAHLQTLIAYFRQLIHASPLQWRDSFSPIQQLQLGCPFMAQAYAEKLAQNQIRCFAIRQPTVSKPETGLRVILNYRHSMADIERLFQVLQA